jgi:hypothetical protein
MPDNPFRKPDYRWERARFLCEYGGPLSPKWDDRWIRRACDFQRRLAGFDGDVDHPRLTRLDPAILGAYRLRFKVDEHYRWQVEARIVGDQPASEIAARSGVSVKVIEAYESLFYAVRDRLRCIDWVATFVFGPRLYRGFREDDVELVWKLFAYNHGYNFLELVLSTVYGVRSGAVIDDADAAAEFARSFRRAVALKAIPVTEKTAPLFIQLAQRLQEINREAEATRVAPVLGPIRIEPIEGSLDRLLDTDLAVAGKAPDDEKRVDESNTLDLDSARKNAQKTLDALFEDDVPGLVES